MAVTVARLLAVLDADTRPFNRQLKEAESTSKRFGVAAKAALIGGAGAAFYGLAKAAKIGWDEFNQGQKVAAQTNAVLESTGGIANVTAKHVEDLGVELMKLSGIDDEVIKGGQNILLTFKGIRNEVGRNNDIFDQATKLSLDMSVALHKDLNSSAIMVGKALNNPAKGLTALTRVGVTFTEQQEKQIKALVESGKTMKAQKIILAELRSEFGGSAKAAGETLGGQINILRERFNNWAGDMVEKAIPMLKRLAAWFSKSILPALRDLGASIRKAWPDIQEFLQELFKGAQKLAPVWRLAIQIIVILIRVWAKFISVYAQGVGKIIEVTARFVGYLREKGGSALEFVRDKLALVRDTARFTFEFIRDKAQLVVDKVRLIIQKLKEFVGFVRGIPGKIGGVFSGVAGAIGGVFGGDGIVAAVGTGPSNISRTLYDDLALGNQAGLVLSSGYRPGAITSTGNPSLHGVFPAKAIDMAGSAAAMWRFFWAEVSRGASSGLREIIHSPYWWHPGVGVTRIPPSAGSVLADHYDHVHVGSYDRGGWLAPGWNLAFNGLGRRERVGGGDTIVNVHGAVIDGEKLYRLIREGEARWRRKNGG